MFLPAPSFTQNITVVTSQTCWENIGMCNFNQYQYRYIIGHICNMQIINTCGVWYKRKKRALFGCFCTPKRCVCTHCQVQKIFILLVFHFVRMISTLKYKCPPLIEVYHFRTTYSFWWTLSFYRIQHFEVQWTIVNIPGTILIPRIRGVSCPGGPLEYKCCTHAWPEVFKTYPKHDFPSPGKTLPKREFPRFWSKIYP